MPRLFMGYRKKADLGKNTEVYSKIMKPQLLGQTRLQTRYSGDKMRGKQGLLMGNQNFLTSNLSKMKDGLSNLVQ